MRGAKRMMMRKMMGKGLFGDVWNGIKSAGSYIGNLLSSGKASKLASIVAPQYSSAIGKASKVAKIVGLRRKHKKVVGKKRRVGRPKK